MAIAVREIAVRQPAVHRGEVVFVAIGLQHGPALELVVVLVVPRAPREHDAILEQRVLQYEAARLDHVLRRKRAGGTFLNRALGQRAGVGDPLVGRGIEPTERIVAVAERRGGVVDVLALVVAHVEPVVDARRDRRDGARLVGLGLARGRVDRIVADVHVAEAIRVGLRQALLHVTDELVAPEPAQGVFLLREIEDVGALAAKRVAQVRPAVVHRLADAEVGPAGKRIDAAVQQARVDVDIEIVAVAGRGGAADHVPVHAFRVLTVPAELQRQLLPVRVQEILLELDGRGVVGVENLVRTGEIEVGVVENRAVRDAGHGGEERARRAAHGRSDGFEEAFPAGGVVRAVGGGGRVVVAGMTEPDWRDECVRRVSEVMDAAPDWREWFAHHLELLGLEYDPAWWVSTQRIR